jgi:hypothetical protein
MKHNQFMFSILFIISTNVYLVPDGILDAETTL